MIALLSILALSSCSSMQFDATSKINITIVNKTDHPVTLRAKASIFSKKIHLEPGQRFVGWIPAILVPKSGVVVEVIDK